VCAKAGYKGLEQAVHFLIDTIRYCDMRVPLLNILFHPSGMHANGHLDAVFVFLGVPSPGPLRGLNILERLARGGVARECTGASVPHPTSGTDLNNIAFMLSRDFLSISKLLVFSRKNITLDS